MTAEDLVARVAQAMRDANTPAAWAKVAAPAPGAGPSVPFEVYARAAVDELLPAGLTAEQEIRVEALHAAVRAGSTFDFHDTVDDTLELAERFAAYIRDGGHCVRPTTSEGDHA